MTPLEQTLARALALAIKDQSQCFERFKGLGVFYFVPDWYQPAVEALAEYDRQQSQEQNTQQY